MTYKLIDLAEESKRDLVLHQVVRRINEKAEKVLACGLCVCGGHEGQEKGACVGLVWVPKFWRF